jgi:hypothetical protein
MMGQQIEGLLKRVAELQVDLTSKFFSNFILYHFSAPGYTNFVILAQQTKRSSRRSTKTASPGPC